MMLLIALITSLVNAQTLYRDKVKEARVGKNSGSCDLAPLNPPAAYAAVCANIDTWTMVPHDWQDDQGTYNSLDGDGTCKGWNQAKNNYEGDDFWYWGDDWPQKIAGGSGSEQMISQSAGTSGCRNANRISGGSYEIKGLGSVQECTQRCMRALSTTESNREKCRYFDWYQPTGAAGAPTTTLCHLYTDCNGGQVAADGWTAYRLIDIYPAGFKYYTLREFNEPPTCIHVPNSRNKKVEVMIETASKDSRVCIMDGTDMGIGTNNDVGNVKTCDNGQLYACFTAAMPKVNGQNEDFYFYIFCDGSCEASDVDLWVRIRVSDRTWDSGKTDTESDIEMWCEMEKGTQAGVDTAGSISMKNEFTWPSELLPDYPAKFPFRISHTEISSAPAASWSAAVAFMLSMLALL